MQGTTVEDIRSVFAEEMVAAATRIKVQFDIPTSEALIGLGAAVVMYEHGARETGWSDEQISLSRKKSEECGNKLYESIKSMCGATIEDPGQPDQPGVAGPGDDSGALKPNVDEVRPDALTLDGSKIVAKTIGDGIMNYMFPLGQTIHPQDSIALCAATLEFLKHNSKQLPVVDHKEHTAREEMRRSLANIKDGVLHVSNNIFGPDGPMTADSNKGTGIIGLDNKEIVRG